MLEPIAQQGIGWMRTKLLPLPRNVTFFSWRKGRSGGYSPRGAFSDDEAAQHIRETIALRRAAARGELTARFQRKRTPPREYPVAVRDDPRWAMLQRARAALRAGDARAYKGLYQLYMRWDELAPLALALQSWARARGARREFVARKRAALAL